MTAPIAQLDDEWENFSSFADLSQSQNDNSTLKNRNEIYGVNSSQIVVPGNHLENTNIIDNSFSDDLNSFGSIEELVHTFDEKLATCFHAKNKYSVPICDDAVGFNMKSFSQDAVWKRLTDNYGLVQPLNWETSHICKLHIPALYLPFQCQYDANKNPICQKQKEVVDKELKEQMDYHGMIEYNVYSEHDDLHYNLTSQNENQEVVQTADEVIEELEEIMEGAAEFNAAVDYEVQQETGLVFDENYIQENIEESYINSGLRMSIGSPSSQEESDRAIELKHMTLSDLNALNEEIEQQVNLLSTELLQELNSRDELQFENEVKNEFISKVLEVQYKREQFCKTNNSVAVSKKFGRLQRSSTLDSVACQGRYLTTVIPCNKGDKLTLDNLQALIKILAAIKADSDEVPSLLTSYILKVLCPAPNGSNVLKL